MTTPRVTLHPSILSVNGTAVGSIVARGPDGKMIDAASGNWLSAQTRGSFARRLAWKVVPHTDPSDGEPAADHLARRASDDVRRAAAEAELGEQILQTVDDVCRQIEADDAEAAAAETDRLRAAAEMPTVEEPEYAADDRGTFLIEWTKNGKVAKKLANFQATITEEVFRDDGVETDFVFTVEARVGNGPLTTFPVQASKFAAMGWVAEKLGARAYLTAGRAVADAARHAIQTLSHATRRTVYCHTGWREVGGRWVYLTAGGAVGADGLVGGVDVDLPGALSQFDLPEPPEGDELIAAVRASLCLLDVAARGVTLPFYAATWRSVQGTADLGVGIFGRTGSLKSSLVAPFQQHFGPRMDKERLPASWASTANAIELLASAAKDSLFVVDEYKPSGIPQEDAKLRQKVDQVVRGGVNGAGRARLTHDIRIRAGRPPRCLVAMTGEEVPAGESLRARMVVAEVKPGDVDKSRLAACQRDARAGLYAKAMSGYLRWLAPRYAEARDGLPARVEELRGRAMGDGLSHARTPEQVASLSVGLGWFLTFAVDCGALRQADVDRLSRHCWQTLCGVAAEQSGHQASEEPTARFVELLTAAIAGGSAHLADHRGAPPANPEAWGWRDLNLGRSNLSPDWQPRGPRVGWLMDDVVYLLPAAAYKAANDMAALNDRVPVGVGTLSRRLRDLGMLVPPPNHEKRDELTVRPTLENRQVRVWKMAGGVLAVPSHRQAAAEEQGLLIA